jgi:nitric oxide reductase subunit C
MTDTPWWASEDVWRKWAIWVTAFMAVVLIFLTFDTVAKITAGGDRVPGYDVINKRIYYKFNSERNMQEPVFGADAPLFGKMLSPQEAEDLVTLGKLTVQAKNCMNCHTLLGNGAYYAPDQLMISFLMDPMTNARTYGTGRRMPQLGITEDEAKGVVAFLKWMSAIDTNGFPRGFKPIRQEESS